MARTEQPSVARKVAELWLRRQRMPAVSPFHLPRGLVAALRLGDLVVGMDCRVYQVTAVGPGGLILEIVGTNETRSYSNEGYGNYAWAFFAAPDLHWLLTG